MTFLVDSHCHLGDLKFGDIDQDLNEVLDNARDAGVTHMLCVNTDLGTFPDMYSRIRERPNVFASVGTHPLNVNDYDWTEQELLDYAEYPKVVAIGEIGLDYHEGKEFAREQKEVLRLQFELAAKLNLPVNIHLRDAWEDFFSVLEDCRHLHLRGNLHCFSGSYEVYERANRSGDFAVGIGGVLTFKNASLPAVVARIPAEHLLLETDAPYLAPVPYRGKRNESAYLPLIAARLAEVKGLSLKEIETITTDNAIRLFNL
jgi:TatD DNase family protein